MFYWIELQSDGFEEKKLFLVTALPLVSWDVLRLKSSQVWRKNYLPNHLLIEIFSFDFTRNIFCWRSSSCLCDVSISQLPWPGRWEPTTTSRPGLTPSVSPPDGGWGWASSGPWTRQSLGSGERDPASRFVGSGCWIIFIRLIRGVASPAPYYNIIGRFRALEAKYPYGGILRSKAPIPIRGPWMPWGVDQSDLDQWESWSL